MSIDEMIAVLQQAKARRDAAIAQTRQMIDRGMAGMDYNMALMGESAGRMKRGIGMLAGDYDGLAAEGYQDMMIAKGKQRRYLEDRALREGAPDAMFANVENTGPRTRRPVGARPQTPQPSRSMPEQTESSGPVSSANRGGLEDFLVPEAKNDMASRKGT